MSDIIRLLPDSLANQIAAGEVVQRPASVVKELMENAIDAGGKNISLVVTDAGKGLIRVIDDGIGMSETDARMSLERHATSKIRSSKDLFSIKTMGFRGEALASIAAVSQMEVKTKREETELGTMLDVAGSEVMLQEPCQCGKGTSISVKNLFYNVPARRNFLKSNGVEMRHIVEEFQRVALAFPAIGFSMFQDEKETYRLEAGKLSQRIVGLFGKSYATQLASCNIDAEFIKISGYVGRPEYAKKTRGDQYLFVNERFIKSHYLNHAVTMAYEGMMPEKYYPFYALFMEIDPSHIDVNVHPTKTEIKFDDERTVYSIVRSAVKQALGIHNITPSLNFSSDVNLIENVERQKDIHDSHYSQFRNTNTRQETNLQHWEKLYDENLMEGSREIHRIVETEGEEALESRIFTSDANVTNTKGDNVSGIMQTCEDYILTNMKSGLMVIDRKAAVERVVYEKYIHNAKNNRAPSQQCLFPYTLELSASDFELITDIRDELHGLGFVFEVFGKHSIVIQGIPADIVNENEKDLLEGLIEQYKNSKDELDLSGREKIIRALARKTAAKAPKQLARVEMEEVVSGLFACGNPNNAPDGRPTFKILERKTIEGFFK